MPDNQTIQKNRGNAGKGRRKGSKNKLPGRLKRMVLQALIDVGGVDYLCRQAEENPTAFLALVAKLMPRTVKGEVETRAKVEPPIIERVIVGATTER